MDPVSKEEAAMRKSWIHSVCVAFALSAIAPAAVAADTGVDEPAANADAPLPSPTAVPRAIIAALRDNDVAGLLASEEIDDLATAEKAWNERRERERERRTAAKAGAMPMRVAAFADEQLAAAWTELLSDEGVEQLVARWQPQIAARAVERVGAAQLALAAGLASIAADPSRTAAERAQLTDLLRAGQAWLMRTDFSDADRLRVALNAVAMAVRRSGLDSFEALGELEFDEAVARFDLLLEAGKQAAAAYDLDLDAILRSASVREEQLAGRDATIVFEFTAFGMPVALRQQLRYVHDTWLPLEAAQATEEYFNEMEARRRAAARTTGQ
jgi:hypothetical protein